MYVTVLTISQLSVKEDSGEYTCTAMITGVRNTLYSTSGSGSISINITNGSNTDVSSCPIGGITDIWTVVGGVVAVAVLLILTVIVHVLVALFRMRQTRKFTQKRVADPVDIITCENEAYDLVKGQSSQGGIAVDIVTSENEVYDLVKEQPSHGGIAVDIVTSENEVYDLVKGQSSQGGIAVDIVTSENEVYDLVKGQSSHGGIAATHLATTTEDDLSSHNNGSENLQTAIRGDIEYEHITD
jgi:hypothetical protein